MSAGANGQAAKLLASCEQATQTPGVPRRGPMMLRAAVRAAATSGVGVGTGVALGVAEVGVGLETLLVAEVAPQPTKATRAANGSRAPKNFVMPTCCAVAPHLRRKPVRSMPVERRRSQSVTNPRGNCSLNKRALVGRARFELAVSWSQTRRFAELSYRPPSRIALPRLCRQVRSIDWLIAGT